MIKTIYISNVLEGYYRSYQSLPNKDRVYWIQYDSMEGNRALFYNGDNKVIITPYLINPKHLKNTCQIMEWRQVFNFTPLRPSPSICEDCIEDNQLKTQLELLIQKNPKVAIIPYRATPQFYHLIYHLKKKGLHFTIPETMSIKEEFVISYCHCKRGFRHIWSKAFPTGSNLQISIPQGFITGNKEEAIQAAWWFQQQNRSFVIKYNKGTQGIGIILNYHSNLPNDKEKFIAHMRALLTGKIWDEPSIIVEELIWIDKTKLGGSPSIEFFINEKGKIIPTYGCEQVLADDKKTFRGVYIHPEVVNHKHIQTAFKAGKFFGQELAALGYRGYYDIDLVISKEDKVYAVESNMRRTGGTHIHEMATYLLGKNYPQSYHVVGEDIILPKDSNLTYEESLSIFNDILFNEKAKSGFVFCNPDMLQVNILNAILIAHSKEKIDNLRAEARKRLKKAIGTKKS